MKLSPLDIRKQEFSRAFRGLDAEEVQAFLQMMASQWEEMLDEQRRLEERVRDMENKLRHYERVEEALEEALKTSRETARQTIDAAERKAQRIIEAAEDRAIQITRKAEDQRHQVKRDTAKISGRQGEIVARLRAFLMSEMELLARFEGEDPVGFIKLLPSESGGSRTERGLPQAAAASFAAEAPEAPSREDGGVPDVELPDAVLGTAAEEKGEESASAGASPSAPEAPADQTGGAPAFQDGPTASARAPEPPERDILSGGAPQPTPPEEEEPDEPATPPVLSGGREAPDQPQESTEPPLSAVKRPVTVQEDLGEDEADEEPTTIEGEEEDNETYDMLRRWRAMQEQEGGEDAEAGDSSVPPPAWNYRSLADTGSEASGDVTEQNEAPRPTRSWVNQSVVRPDASRSEDAAEEQSASEDDPAGEVAGAEAEAPEPRAGEAAPPPADAAEASAEAQEEGGADERDSSEADPSSLSASEEEIAKIRRILDDLD